MHTFGHPVDLDGLLRVTERWGLKLVEDAAESLGSFYKGKHTGTFGKVGVLSFNGNKIMTTGGGGMILTNESTGAIIKHLNYVTASSRICTWWGWIQLQAAQSERRPGCAQLEQLESFIASKRRLAKLYQKS